jgi:hypothetical protein
MSSLFAWKRNATPAMLSLPAFCTPTSEAENLRTKREAQLEWMRNHGVHYLVGKPVTRPVTLDEVTVEPVPALAQRAAAALHTLRRLNAEQIKAANENASGKAA